MAWQRKIPFGYMMRNGKIAPCPEESEAVAFIYDSYQQGESYLSIAKTMTELGIRYHDATAEWNKHMVKRILENPKYTGREEYPAILPTEVWQTAQTVRSRKTAGWQNQSSCVEILKRRMVCGECGSAFSKDTPTSAIGNRWWHCGNGECTCTLKIRDNALEEAVTALLNLLIIQPELLDRTEASETPLSLEAARMQNEINRELGKMELNEEYLTALILGCAAEKYTMLDGNAERRKAARLKAEICKRPLLTAFDPVLFGKAADALLVRADGSLALLLVGGNIISETGKEHMNHADNR